MVNGDWPAGGPSMFPQAFVDRLNESRPGLPALTIAHPLAMLLYTQSLTAGRLPPVTLLSGI